MSRLPPERGDRLSKLISIFEHPPPDQDPTPTANAITRPPPSLSLTRNIAPGQTGLVSNQIRRFSPESFSSLADRSDRNVRSDGVIAGKVSEMDWKPIDRRQRAPDLNPQTCINKPVEKSVNLEPPPAPISLVSPFIDPQLLDEKFETQPLLDRDQSSGEEGKDEASVTSLLRLDAKRKVIKVSPHDLFKPSAAPLILPHLEEYLDRAEPIQFSDFDMSTQEKLDWAKWLENVTTQTWWRRLIEKLRRKKYEEIEQQSSTLIRQSIFPPFHTTPASLTVDDFKRNNGTPAPLFTSDAALLLAMTGVLAGLGSNYGIAMAKLEIFRDLVQTISVLHNPSSTSNSTFRTVTGVLSGNFASTFGYVLIFFYLFTLMAAWFVYEIYRFTGGWHLTQVNLGVAGEEHVTDVDPEGKEGWRRRWRGCMKFRNARWYKIAVIFGATTLYLPLSRMSISALVWGDDYWTVALDDLANLNGPRCYTTKIDSNSFNWAYILLIVAGSTIIWLTVWLPYRLYTVTRLVAPKVDRYTELGLPRKDCAEEYERLVELDQSPFNFLFNEYRRPYASYKTIYMMIKLVNVLLLVVISTSNCVFLNRSPTYVAVVRSSCQLVIMSIFLAASFIVKPFIWQLSNSSDQVSRLAYAVVALFGLFVALDLPGSAIFGNQLMILVEVTSYLSSGYFALISTGWVQSVVVKRLAHRLDFSIDIFAPPDVLALGKHIAVRVHQETLSLVLLTSHETKMGKDQALRFSELEDAPPYLLDFQGSVAERHIENLQILRVVGMQRYRDAISIMSNPRIVSLSQALYQFLGPDAVWYSPTSTKRAVGQPNFGRLDLIPFPFCCVFRHDDEGGSLKSPVSIIAEEADLELLLRQNQSKMVVERRGIRRAIRCLEGQVIHAPYTLTSDTSTSRGRWRWRLNRQERITVTRRVEFRTATVRIDRNSPARFTDGPYNYSPGFRVSLHYSDGITVDSDGKVRSGIELKLDLEEVNEFSLTTRLAQLFVLNRKIIDSRLPVILGLFKDHSERFKTEAETKRFTLSYDFTLNVFLKSSLSLDSSDFTRALRISTTNPVVQNLLLNNSAAMNCLSQRMKFLQQSSINQFWYLYWDDIWRRNHTDNPLLEKHEASFSPYYKNSICYKIVSRGMLESFLAERGFSISQPYFSIGFINKLYFYLNELIFAHTSKSIPLYVSDRRISYRSSPLASSLSTLPPSPPRPHHESDPSLAILPQILSRPGQAVPILREVELMESKQVIASGERAGAGGTIEHNDPLIRFRSSFPFEIFLDNDVYDSADDNSNRKLGWKGNGAWRSWRRKKSLAIQEWLGLVVRIGNGRSFASGGVGFDLTRTDSGWELPTEPRHF